MDVETLILFFASEMPEVAEQLRKFVQGNKVDKEDLLIMLNAQMLSKLNNVSRCVAENKEDLQTLKLRIKAR